MEKWNRSRGAPAVAEDDDLEERAPSRGHRDLPRARAPRAWGGQREERLERERTLSSVCYLAVATREPRRRGKRRGVWFGHKGDHREGPAGSHPGLTRNIPETVRA